MMYPLSLVLGRIFLVIFALGAACSSGGAQALGAASPWVESGKAKARLVTGDAGALELGTSRLAFIEIALEPGWKTYWRAPGDAGGLPPEFDWSKSSNLASANVKFPAPELFVDRSGNTIGYHDGLVLPVVLTPEDPNKPIALTLGLAYGICKDVCIPVEAELTVDVAPGSDEPLPEEALAALDRVPREQGGLKDGDPVLVRAGASLADSAPKLTIEAKFPGGAEDARIFLEAPGGAYLPLPVKVADGADGALVFEADLSRDVDLAAIKGAPITLTLVGAEGASTATFVAE